MPFALLSQESAETPLKLLIREPLFLGSRMLIAGFERPVPFGVVLDDSRVAQLGIVGARSSGERFGHKGFRGELVI